MTSLFSPCFSSSLEKTTTPFPSIGLLGVGFIGTSLLNFLLTTSCHLYLYDTKKNILQGKILDALHGRQSFQTQGSITIVENPEDLFACDVVVITAGKVREKHMTREDLLRCNGDIVAHYGLLFKEEKKKNPHYNPLIVMVTNPLDTMSYVFQRLSGHDPHRIVGMAGLLDSVRLRYFTGVALGENPEDIGGYVVGAHNDTMVPLRSSMTLRKTPLSEKHLSPSLWASLVAKTKSAGSEISSLLSTENFSMSAFTGPSACIFQLLQDYFMGKDHLLCCALESLGEEQGYLYGGALASFGPEGVCSFSIPLETPEEKDLWIKSLDSLKKSIHDANTLFFS